MDRGRFKVNWYHPWKEVSLLVSLLCLGSCSQSFSPDLKPVDLQRSDLIKAQALHMKVQTLVRKRDLKAALAAAEEEAKSLSPQSSNVLRALYSLELGEMQLRSGFVERAFSSLSESAETISKVEDLSATEGTRVAKLLARTAFIMGDYQACQRFADQALEYQAKLKSSLEKADLLLIRAMAEAKLKQRELLDKSVREGLQQAERLFGRGSYRTALLKAEGAAAYYHAVEEEKGDVLVSELRALVKDNPGWSPLFMLLPLEAKGELLSAKGHSRQAQGKFREAYAICKTYCDRCQRSGNIPFANEEVDYARLSTLRLLSLFEKRSGNLEQAAELNKEALSYGANQLPAFYRLILLCEGGEIRLGLKDRVTAARFFKEAEHLNELALSSLGQDREAYTSRIRQGLAATKTD